VVSQGAKQIHFLHFEYNYLSAIYAVKGFEISYTNSHTSLLEDKSMVRYAKKCLIYIFCTKTDIMSDFWRKKGLGTLGVKLGVSWH